MSKYQRIPRPRHLFPELAAFLIEWKRSNLRVERNLRRAIGKVPIWVTGSLAGIAGIMLAISLFFVHDPQLQAAATPVVLPIPIPVAPPPQPVDVEPTVARPRPAIHARLVRMAAPPGWDESKISTSSSVAPARNLAVLNRAGDQWKRWQDRKSGVGVFDSYLTRAAGFQSSWPSLSASDVVSNPLQYAELLRLGLSVEKTANLQGAPNEPVTYQIVVRNISFNVIENISIRERITSLVRVSETLPSAGISGEELIWNIDELVAGASRTFLVTVVPDTTGEIRTETHIVSKSRFSASVNVKPAPVPDLDVMPFVPAEDPKPTPDPQIQVVPGRPELKLTYTEVRALKQGDNLSMIFAVTNVGTASAEDVILYVRLSGQFEHRYGAYVKHQVGKLGPGEMRRALLQATARDPGDAHLDASLTMQGSETEARELKIPIRSELPAGGSKESPLVNRPVYNEDSRWIAAEQGAP